MIDRVQKEFNESRGVTGAAEERVTRYLGTINAEDCIDGCIIKENIAQRRLQYCLDLNQ